MSYLKKTKNQIRKKLIKYSKKINSFKKDEGVPLLNFKADPRVPLLNFQEGSWGPTFKLEGGSGSYF